MLVPGSLIDGKYKVLKILGTGGMSVVYLAVNERANKHWAVKEIRKDAVNGTEIARQSLVVETEILKRIRHPSLPRIIDVIDTEDSLLIVMDYIHGKTLEKVVKESGVPSQIQVIDWAIQLCDVLDYLHSRKPAIIYRDMKPSNIILTPEGRLVLIDFGTALEMEGESGEAGVSLGTVGYAAPEQYRGSGQLDARTDIYCLGVTLHYLLTGQEPRGSHGGLCPVRRLDPGLTEGLEQIIIRCTRERPQDRYQNCRQLRYDLEHHENLQWSFRKRNLQKFQLFMFVCLLMAGLGMGVLITGGYYRYLIGLDYRGYLEQARQAERLADMADLVHKAVLLDRGNPEAYETMLSWIGSDHLMTDEEKTAIESLLYEKSGGCQNITLFRRHRRAFDAFSYDFGVACFFYYKGSRGKDIARLWFEGLEHSGLARDQKARALIYSRIGSYYSSLSNAAISGETKQGDYTTFFNDLTALNSYSPKDLASPGAAVVLYSEIASQIGNHARDFLTKGEDINALKLKSEILKIKRYITYDSMDKASRDDMEKLIQNLEDADKKIAAAESLNRF